VKQQEFLQTQIGKIPKDWGLVELLKIGGIITGTTPSTKVEEYWGKGYPFVTPTDFSGKKYVYDTGRTVTQNGVEKARVVPKDSIMVVCIASIGEVAMASTECITNQQINTIVCNKECDKNYIYYAILSSKNRLKRWAGITTSPIIKKSLFEKFPIPVPPLPEQKKIAEILSTVDQAIEKVDGAIEKTQKLKKGMMQELLTKGIGHNEFKETELGRIPKEWKVIRLENVIKEMKNGFASGKRDDNGIVQIRMNNVTTDGQLKFDSYLKVPKPESLKEWLLRKGDLLFNNTNSYDLVGKSTILNTAPFPCTFSNHFTRIRFTDEVIPEWILFHFITFWDKGFFKSVAIRHVGQSAVHTKYLTNIKLPLPPLPEQQKIAEILSAVDERLNLLRKRKERLGRIKKGLMNDLLTGKVRVTSLISEEGSHDKD
jgi:type I restriction enzyme S subunit